ncbi:hypothetical protein VPHD528_0112 [Vibrio phage D528]
MKLTVTQIETLIQMHVTGNAYKGTSNVKYSPEIMALSSLQNVGDTLAEVVKPEAFDLMGNNRMLRAFRFMEARGFRYAGDYGYRSKSPKSYIKMIDENGLTGWFSWEGYVYINDGKEVGSTLYMKNGKEV